MADQVEELMEELSGPEVLASRGQTTDSGGGRLVLAAGKLLVRGAVRGRVLGEIIQLRAIAFSDAGGRRAELEFEDGTVWVLTDKKKGRLLQFCRSIEGILGRSDLVSVAPGFVEQVKLYLTPERRWQIAIVVAAALAAWSLSLAVAKVAALGIAVIWLAVAWLLAVVLAKTWKAARWLAPVGAMARKSGRGVAVAVPLLLMAGSAAGLQEAGRRSVLAAKAERERLQALEQQELAAKREAERKRRDRERADVLAGKMDAAMKESRWRDAHGIYLKIKELSPEHESLNAVGAELKSELAALDEKERLVAVTSGVRQARRIVKDRVMCESAKTVADVWSKLRRVRPGDERWLEAAKATEKLERCRERLESIFGRNVIAVREQERSAFSRTVRQQLRERGYASDIELEGKAQQIMNVVIANLSEADAAAISQDDSGQDDGLLERAERVGFRRVVLSDGKRKSWKYDLEPEDESSLGNTVLEKFGLDKPLRIEAPSAAAQEG